jgi:hypothetical protein
MTISFDVVFILFLGVSSKTRIQPEECLKVMHGVGSTDTNPSDVHSFAPE